MTQLMDRQGRIGVDRNRKGQPGTDRDRQEQMGTDRDRKGLSLLISEKSRDKTGKKSQNRDNTGTRRDNLVEKKNRDKPSKD